LVAVQSARAAKRITATAKVRETQWGKGDAMLTAEIPLEQPQAEAQVYKKLLRDKGLTRYYGVRVERRYHGLGVVLIGRHDDQPMPCRSVV
jgi:hypothetical protein